MMPGGFIWPPVDGRTLLHEVARLDLRPTRNAKGDWSAVSGGWRCHSCVHDIFDTLESGRAALIDWARRHASSVRELSPGRVLVLADAGSNRFRLWQLLRVEPGLREQLEGELADASPRDTVSALLLAANQLLRARFTMRTTGLNLPLSLWTIGADHTLQPCYVGLMPSRPSTDPAPGPDELLAREFRPVLGALRRERQDFPEVEAHLRSRARADDAAAILADLSAGLPALVR